MKLVKALSLHGLAKHKIAEILWTGIYASHHIKVTNIPTYLLLSNCQCMYPDVELTTAGSKHFIVSFSPDPWPWSLAGS